MISSELISWYQSGHRKLPWRETRDPYRIWISEVILQQTRIDQGLPYYNRFIALFPDVFMLARARNSKVLKAWQGLGYYSRALNLHKTSKTIVNKYKGVFPEDYHELLKLDGIGPYTAAAVASIAYNKPYAVLDGNVARVISRLFAIRVPVNSATGKKILQQKANELLDGKRPALHNQAMMELGALICKPQAPLCSQCPLQSGCKAFNTGIELQLPVKQRNHVSQTIRIHYLLITDGQKIILSRRNSGGIWKHLFDFPAIELTTDKKLTVQQLQRKLKNYGITTFERSGSAEGLKHILTHRMLLADYSVIKTGKKLSKLRTTSNEKIVSVEDLKKYPVPRLIEKIIELAEIDRITRKRKPKAQSIRQLPVL
ncbi:MAG: A/G-specific adenine glycosylase [Bacteroidia bacterium]|nr:A/G-specific adenine glycosylase [Bacteroidia bacterium]MCZ2276540.1 A/G-specific adenine glycosylase [Bacteroidia bacterium]